MVKTGKDWGPFHFISNPHPLVDEVSQNSPPPKKKRSKCWHDAPLRKNLILISKPHNLNFPNYFRNIRKVKLCRQSNLVRNDFQRPFRKSCLQGGVNIKVKYPKGTCTTHDHVTECFNRRLCVRPTEMRRVSMLCSATTINCTLWRRNSFRREKDTSCQCIFTGK